MGHLSNCFLMSGVTCSVAREVMETPPHPFSVYKEEGPYRGKMSFILPCEAMIKQSLWLILTKLKQLAVVVKEGWRSQRFLSSPRDPENQMLKLPY